MLQKREEGFFDFLAIENDRGDFCGLAIMLLSGEFALLDYLAIAPESLLPAKCHGSHGLPCGADGG